MRRRSLPLGLQVAITILLTTAVAGGVAVVLLSNLVLNDAERQFEQRLEQSRLLVEARLEQLAAEVLAQTMALSGHRPFVGAMSRGETPEALAEAARVRSGRDGAFDAEPALALYRPDEQVLLRSHQPPLPADEPAPEEVRRALAGRSHDSGFRVVEGLGLVAFGISPIVGADDSLIGAAELLVPLDDAFAGSVAELTGTTVAFLAGGTVSASSESALKPAAAAISAAATSLGASPGYVELDGTRYLSSMAPIASRDGDTAGYLFTGVPRDLVFADAGNVSNRMLLALLIAGGIAVSAATLFTIGAVRPVQALARSAQRIRANDLDTPVPVAGSREIRRLGLALDEMRRAIQQGRESLLLTNEQLAQQMDASAASLSAVTEELGVMHAVLAQLGTDSPGGVAGAVEELTRLSWVDAAMIAIVGEDGVLSRAGTIGFSGAGAAALLELTRERMPQAFVIEQTGRDAPHVAAHGVGGVAVTPMVTPEGVAGVVVVASKGPMTLSAGRERLLGALAREFASVLEISELSDEVEESRRIAEAVLREMSDGVLLIDEQRTCHVCNPAASRLLGVRRGEIVGSAAEDFLPFSRETIQGLHQRVERGVTGAPLLAEVDGRQLAVSSGPFQGPNPGRTGMIVLIRDLSSEAEAERVKQDFVSMVGHELRTPLTLIRTSIELLREPEAGPLNETQDRIVGMLQGNSERLMALIGDLLDMSALDSGRLQISPEAMDLGESVAAVLEHQRAASIERGLDLRLELPNHAVIVWGDRARVEQVLQNLLSNALKYTPAGGRVTVRVADRQAFGIVEVEDTGIGIPPEEQAQLFEKFFRTAAGRTTTGGTGLGLAIARSIVELHGGELSVRSDGHSGSTFAFALPHAPRA